MDILKVLQWVILIFAFYVFIFYAFFRIIYRKLKEINIKSNVKIEKSDEVIPNSNKCIKVE